MRRRTAEGGEKPFIEKTPICCLTILSILSLTLYGGSISCLKCVGGKTSSAEVVDKGGTFELPNCTSFVSDAWSIF